MSTTIEAIKKAVSTEPSTVTVEVEVPRFGWDNPKYTEQLEEASRKVVDAYQNAQRWMDTIKEKLLIDHHLPYFSHIVHELAHTMPVRFDAFGQILHTENLEIYYPSTEEWSHAVPNVKDAINHIHNFLDSIQEALILFQSVARSCSCTSMAISCDTLITDISNERYFFFRAEEMLEFYGMNMSQWDKSVYQFWKEYKNLI